MSEIVAGGRLVFSDVNTPTRVGELINTLSEIYDIPTPRVGMRVYVRDEEKEYIIRSLKSKVVGGITVPDAAVDEYELASDTLHVEWSEGMSMNSFTKEGVYSIRGLRMGDNDSLPIANVGKNASFAAKLFVTVTPEGTTVYRHIIGQTLILSNAEGNETKIYTRSGKSVTPNDESIEWSAWTMMQGNREVGAVGSLDEFTDNGIYSGVLIDLAARVMETFLLVVINDYAVKGEYRQISQFKYALGTNTGVVSYTTRYLPSNSSVWTPWEDINERNIERAIEDAINGVVDSAPVEYDTLGKVAEWINDDAERMAARIQANADAIEAEAERTGEVESRLERYIDSVKGAAARVDGNLFTATADEVKLTTTGVDTTKQYTVTLPAATETKAGVMSADDKKKLDNITPGGDVTTEQLADAIEKGRQLALRSLFIAAGAEYNDTDQIIKKTAPWEIEETWVKNADGTYTYSEVPATVDHLPGRYYLNGLGDITEEQMIEIYNEKDTMFRLWQNGFANKNDSVRTFIPITKARLYDYKAAINLDFGAGLSNLETVVFNTLSIKATDLATMLRIDRGIRFFANCPKLRYVGYINVSDMLAGGIIGFQNCTALEYVNIINLKLSLSLENSPLISKHSIQQMIKMATPTAAISITLHPDAYARLAEDVDIVTALATNPLITLVSA